MEILASQKVFPKIAKEWHPTKNHDLKPCDVTSGISKVVWWQCSKVSSHEWMASICNRTRVKKTGCPFCSGHKAHPTNKLRKLFRKLASEWYPTENGILKPIDVVAGSSKNVWWQCRKDKNHVWQAMISNRSKKKFGLSILF